MLEHATGDVAEFRPLGIAGQHEALAFHVGGNIENETNPVGQHQAANAFEAGLERFGSRVHRGANLARDVAVKRVFRLVEVAEVKLSGEVR